MLFPSSMLLHPFPAVHLPVWTHLATTLAPSVSSTNIRHGEDQTRSISATVRSISATVISFMLKGSASFMFYFVRKGLLLFFFLIGKRRLCLATSTCVFKNNRKILDMLSTLTTTQKPSTGHEDAKPTWSVDNLFNLNPFFF